MAVLLCGLEMMAYPHTVLLKGLAESRTLAREARGRGRPRAPAAVERRYRRARASVHSPRGAPGAGAETDRRVPRRRPDRLSLRREQPPPFSVECGAGLTRAAPSVHRHGSRAKAVWRLRLTETARARLWARLRRAFPVSGFCSNLARYFCPGSFPRRNRVAASEQAHRSEEHTSEL